MEGFFSLFKRHHRESTSLKHTAASSGLSLETVHAVVGPTGLSSPGEDGRRVGSERHAPRTPVQRIILRIVRGFLQTDVEHGEAIVLCAQILLFTRVLKDGRGGRAFSAGLLAGSSPWVSVLHFVRVFWFWGLFFARGRVVVTEQKWDSPSSCALPCLFLKLLISVETRLAHSVTITATLKVCIVKSNEMLWEYLNILSLNSVSFLIDIYRSDLNPIQEV